jgi:hypothetical protein
MMKYVKTSEQWWRGLLAQIGYEPNTTFFTDLSIADCFGEPIIRSTYNKVLEEWGDNIVYMTEFVLCLNHKIWQLYKVNEPLAKVYNELWEDCTTFVEEHFEGEDLSYFYHTID